MLQSIVLLILLTLVSIAVLIISFVLGLDLNLLQPLSLVNLLPTTIAMTLSVWIARRLFDRRSFASLGLRLDPRALPDVLVGFLIAGVMMGVIYAIEAAAGWLRFDGWAWQTLPAGTVALGLLSGLLAFTLVGFQEELLHRGYILQNVRDGMGLRWGLLLSSGIFALMHLGNPNVTWYSHPARADRRRALPCLRLGAHAPALAVDRRAYRVELLRRHRLRLSGQRDRRRSGWFARRRPARSDLTGGPFGPEAGLLLVPALAVGVGLIWLHTRGRLASPAS